MASVYSNSKRQWVAQYTAAGRRSTIYLGQVPKGFAEEFGRGLGCLVDCVQFRQSLDRKTAHWLADLPPRFRQKLAQHGLAEAATVSTVAELCRYCIDRVNGEPSTVTKYRDAEANLVKFFGADKPLHQVTVGDAHEFRRWLKLSGSRVKKNGQELGGPLADTTVSKRCQQAKTIFKKAVDKRWLLDNPFDQLKGWVTENPDRYYFVERETITRLLAENTDPDLELVIILTRYLGIRVRESLDIQWDWVDWDPKMGKIQVLDSKRKRFPIKRWRYPPLFPEVRCCLEAAFERAPEGAVHLINESVRQLSTTAITNRLERLCRRCGIKLWEKPWQNMRSTRETELCDEFPIQTVCAWIGNDPRVAIRHYNQVTKEHHARATSGDTKQLQRSFLDELETLHFS